MNTARPIEPELVKAANAPGERAVIYSLACPGQPVSLPSGRETDAFAPAETSGEAHKPTTESGWNIWARAPLITFRKYTVSDTPAPSPTISVRSRRLPVEWLDSFPDRIVIGTGPDSPLLNAYSPAAIS